MGHSFENAQRSKSRDRQAAPRSATFHDASESWACTPSAFTACYVPHMAREAGFDEYFTKPANLDQLAVHVLDPAPRQP